MYIGNTRQIIWNDVDMKNTINTTQAFPTLVVLATLTILASCGGGGNSNGAIDPQIAAAIEPSPFSWQLVFEDEFDQAVLDRAIWEPQIGDGTAEGIPGWGNDELQFYLDSSISLEPTVDDPTDGKLVITARKENQGGLIYTSGRMRTQGNFDFSYGRVEAKIKMPSGVGFWSAFWLLGSDPSPYGIWPSKGEIDIVEFVNGDSEIINAMHFGMEIPQRKMLENRFQLPAIAEFLNPNEIACAESAIVDNELVCVRANPFIGADGFSCKQFGGLLCLESEKVPYCNLPAGAMVCPRIKPDEDFHVYAIEWSADNVRWFFDGIHIHTVSSGSYWTYGFRDPETGFVKGGPSAPFSPGFLEQDGTVTESPHHILLNVAVGGDLTGGAIPDVGSFPATMEVDYVRVYECVEALENDVERVSVNGTGCTGNIDSVVSFRERKDPNGTLPATNNAPFTNQYTYYDGTDRNAPDTPAEERVPVGVQSLFEDINERILTLEVDSNSNELIQTEVASGDREKVIDIVDSGTELLTSGRVAIVDIDSENRAELQGVGNGVFESGRLEFHNFGGEIRFDIFVDEGNTDITTPLNIGLESTDMESMPAVRTNYTTLDYRDIPRNQWTTVSIRMSDILRLPPPTKLDPISGEPLAPVDDVRRVDASKITGFALFQTLGRAHIQLDNIQFLCGQESLCGILIKASQPFQVFGSAPNVDGPRFISRDPISGDPILDEFTMMEIPLDLVVSPRWNRGIVGFDMDNGDYVTPQGKHVEWSTTNLNPSPLVENDNVIEVEFDDAAQTKLVFIGTERGTSVNLTSYVDGDLVFDIRVLDNPSNEPIFYKVDYAIDGESDPGSTGEIQILPDPIVGQWQTVRVPTCTLRRFGLDDSKITAPLVIVPGVEGMATNVNLQLDNIFFDHIGTGTCDVQLPLDFEIEGLAYAWGNFEGGVTSVIDNPFVTADNSSETVSKMVKNAGGFGAGNVELNFGGSFLDLTSPVDFSNGSAFTINVLANRIGLNLGIKIENSSDPAINAAQTVTTLIGNGQWETLTFDLTGQEASSLNRIVLIIDDGIRGDGGDNFTIHFDNIAQTSSSLLPPALPITFDDPLFAYPLTDFNGANSSIVPDPDPSGTRGNVGSVLFPENSLRSEFAGTTHGGIDGFVAPIPIVGTDVTFSVDVYSPRLDADIELKIEDASDSNRRASILVRPTVVNQWETFTVTLENLEPETFEKIIMSFNLGKSFTLDEERWYWDNLQIVSP